MPANFPAGSDLVTYFASCGYPTITTDEADGLIASAVAEFEVMSGHRPFLATVETNTFDTVLGASNDGYRLEIEDHPFMKTGAEIVHRNPLGVETTLTAGEDYDLLPLNAGVDQNPHWIVRFRSNLCGGKVKITAPFGYATTVPQDVYDAVLEYATAIKLDRLFRAGAFSAGGMNVSKVKQGPVELTAGSASHTSDAKVRLGEVASRYRY
jgi:hypothetical protein